MERLQRTFELVAMAFGVGDLAITALLRGQDDRHDPAVPHEDKHADEDNRRNDLAPKRDVNVLRVVHCAASGITRSSMTFASRRTASASAARAFSSSAWTVFCASSVMLLARCAYWLDISAASFDAAARAVET